MKSKSLLGVAIALFFLAACKKNDPVTEPPIIIPPVEKIDPLELLGDSVSYTIDGEKIAINTVVTRAVVNAKSNVKLDSVAKGTEYTSGDRDSVLFGRQFKMYNDHSNGIIITFLKKYNISEAKSNPPVILHVPNNKLDLFSIGERRFALDFQRNNAQNGIAIELMGKYYGLQSNGYNSFVHHIAIKSELQTGSKFEIISLKKLKSGKYLLEANFNASVYRGDGTNIKKIENGYLRLKINPDSPYL